MQGVRLLIVDDDEDDYVIVKELLEDISRGPFVLDWASSYGEGESYLKQNGHDLCLMDYKLGAHDGIELLKRADKLGFSGPIILLTGMHEGEVDMQALEAGAVDYLVKDGLSAEQLARSIRYALARKDMEFERVERLRAEAENRSKSEFLAHLSHELRTPLSAILGFTELLINDEEKDERLAHLNIVHRNGKHLLGLLNDILDLSKIEAGKLELELQTVQLIPLLTDIYALMRAAAVDKNLILNLQAPEPLPTSVRTDPTRLRQVLLNLLGNAIKFTHEGYVNLGVKLIDTPQGERLMFFIEDTGIGISSDSLDNIFQPFVQATNELSHTRVGTGLGLTISRQLVERLGGEISVTSEKGRGSRFEFVINPGDLSDVEREVFSVHYAQDKNIQGAVPQYDGRVLVVDDLRDIRSLVGHFVTRSGVEVNYAVNGEEALQKIEKHALNGSGFDLVFMDIHMPVKDGIEAAKEIRERGYDFPLVALTAAHMKGDSEKYLASGFTECLSKPIDQQRMSVCLRRFLPSKSADEHQAVADDSARQVLVVEDSSDALQATCGLLKLIGWSPLAAQNGEQAVALAKKHRPDRALVDLNLPDTNGYLLSRVLHDLVPEMMITIASGEQVNAVELEKPYLCGSVLKPLTLEALQNVVLRDC